MEERHLGKPREIRELEESLHSNPRRSLALRLTIVARLMWKSFDSDLERSGLSRAKWRVIVAVHRHPGSTQRFVAEKVGVTEVTVGRLVDRLCADGYLERRPNPGDRRALNLFPTDVTEPLLEQLSGVAAGHELKAFSGFNDEELAQMYGYMSRIFENLGSYEKLQDSFGAGDDLTE